jgi:hypothetical protein
MRVLGMLLLPAIAAACIACRAGRNLQNVPAIIANPSPQTEAELRRVISSALYGAPFTMPDNPLTQSSVLTVEAVLPDDPNAANSPGSTERRTIEFRLLINGPNCILVNRQDLRRWRLTQTLCVTE